MYSANIVNLRSSDTYISIRLRIWRFPGGIWVG